LLTGRIITCIVVTILAIQLLPVHQTNDYIYDDDSSEVCVSIGTNDDGGNLIDFALPSPLSLNQQIISFNRFYTKCKIFPGFPVCNYSNYFTDIPTPPPDKAA
jgi:hypothetical protein